MTWSERLDHCDGLIAAKQWDELDRYVRAQAPAARSWVTCAWDVGVLLPARHDGTPNDEKLCVLGGRFYVKWTTIAFDKTTRYARATLREIEARALKVLEQVGA